MSSWFDAMLLLAAVSTFFAVTLADVRLFFVLTVSRFFRAVRSLDPGFPIPMV